MDYTTLTAKQLQELCRERGVDTARDKATMIKRLQEEDAAKEIEEFYGDEPAPLPDGVLPASEDESVSVDPEPTPKPVQTDTAPAQDAYRIVEGGFTMDFKKHGKLDNREHHHNMSEVRAAAERAGYTPYGPAFRVNDPSKNVWVYRVGVK